MPNALPLMLLSQLLNSGGQASQAQPPSQPQAQPQGQNAQGAQPQAQGGKAGSSGPPKPSPLELVLKALTPLFASIPQAISGLIQSSPPSMPPRSFAAGGVAGLGGPETVQVGERGPEAIVPLNRPQVPNANVMLPALLQMMLRRPQAPSPVVSRPMVPSQNTGIFSDLLNYFQDRQGSNTGLALGRFNNPMFNRQSGLSSLI